MNSTLAFILIFLGFPVTPAIVYFIRHRPKYLEPGVGTQHIVFIGNLVTAGFIGAGLALLFGGE